MKHIRDTWIISSTILLAIMLPQLAYAYIGPGTGLSAIGAFLALVVGVIVAILGFIWYPLKRIFGKKSQEPDHTKHEAE